MTNYEWQTLRESLVDSIQKFESGYNESNCKFKLDTNGADPRNCIVRPLGFKYKGSYVFGNSFFKVYVDGWYHNYHGQEDDPSWRRDFPRGYKSGLTRLIQNFCKENGLYCELRKAFRDTANQNANTCAFLIALTKQTGRSCVA